MHPPTKIPPTPSHVPKLSQSLVDFAAPLLSGVESAAAFDAAISLAVQLWNIGALSEARRGEALWHLSAAVRRMPGVGATSCAAADLAEFTHRRATEYAADRRIITDHRVIWEKGGPRLEVVAYDLTAAEAEARAKAPANPGSAPQT
jgi:hypothetical protein